VAAVRYEERRHWQVRRVVACIVGSSTPARDDVERGGADDRRTGKYHREVEAASVETRWRWSTREAWTPVTEEG
jgi:hypothetical protein